MNTFVQFHFLTFYPPSNPNRDDLGRPKTAIVGGEHRMRISSQSLKRSWRISKIFESVLGEHKAKRTRRQAVDIYKKLREKGLDERISWESARLIINRFLSSEIAHPGEGKNPRELKFPDDVKLLEHKELCYITPEEITSINNLIEQVVKTKKTPDKDGLNLLSSNNSGVDMALFGRMIAKKGFSKCSVDASMQVAHAFTVNKVDVEEDFFTAVDDLNDRSEDAGSAHMGVTEFSSGLFYLYVCLDKKSLLGNLSGNKDLMQKSLSALTEAMATVGPDGKQNSFANRVYPSYILVEKGNKQPRSLAVSFLQSIDKGDFLSQAIKKMKEVRDNMDTVYGKCAESEYVLNAVDGKGSLTELAAFVAED